LSPALRGSGDCAPLPKQVACFVSDEALAPLVLESRGGEGSLDAQARKRPLDPHVNSSITVPGRNAVPIVLRRKNQAVCPINIMGDNATPSGPANKRAQRCELFDLPVMLKIPK